MERKMQKSPNSANIVPNSLQLGTRTRGSSRKPPEFTDRNVAELSKLSDLFQV